MNLSSSTGINHSEVWLTVSGQVIENLLCGLVIYNL